MMYGVQYIVIQKWECWVLFSQLIHVGKPSGNEKSFQENIDAWVCFLEVTNSSLTNLRATGDLHGR